MTIIKTSRPHITRVEGVCGGRPIIRGTRTTVRSIVGYYKIGMSVDDILKAIPHLTLAQIHDAISYYYDNQEEIDRDTKENMILAGEIES